MCNRMKQIIAVLMLFVLALSALACGGGNRSVSYADGVYTGRSADHQDDEDGNGAGYGEVELEIKDGRVTACSFTMYELDGTLKDENYGADLSKENRLKAQKAVQSAAKYAAMLVEAGALSGVDAISGATISYNEFIEAVNDALQKAAE